MKELILEKYGHLPVGFHRDSHQPVSLHNIGADPDQLIDLDALAPEEVIHLIIEYCQSGGWEDIIHGEEGLITKERGVAEIGAQTDIGKRLLSTYKRALEMILEDLKEGN